jgi:predicted DNA-binding transcriptional regulator YafY
MINYNKFDPKLKRQIEIIGLCLSETKIEKSDLEDIFNCEEPTIKRDLNSLRSMGIDIHSTKRGGISITKPLDKKNSSNFIKKYVQFISSDESFDKATNSLIEELKDNSLEYLVKLQKSIEDNSLVEIDYCVDENNILPRIPVAPLLFFQRNGSWRILALNKGTIKQYIILKIRGIRETGKKFVKSSDYEIEHLFKYSFNSWLSNKKYDIELSIKKQLFNRIKNRIFSQEHSILNEMKEWITIKMSINSIDEIAEWIAGKGDNVKVINPKDLKKKVIEIGKSILKNYRK